MLNINNVTCGYRDKTVLFDINVGIQAGEFVGVIGPNGSGKTTLLRLFSRAITPQNGKVLLNNRDICQVKPKEIAREIAVVSQEQPASEMTVEEFVYLGRLPHYANFQFFDTTKDRALVEKVLDVTGTVKLRNCSLNRISGGERQLVFIARALAQEPKILLLDEPTNHLDIAHQVMVLDLIRNLNRNLGLTVITILHDLNLAAEYCRRILLLDQGRIYSDGTPGEVLTYQKIEAVYKTVVVVSNNPVSSKPYVFLVSGDEQQKV